MHLILSVKENDCLSNRKKTTLLGCCQTWLSFLCPPATDKAHIRDILDKISSITKVHKWQGHVLPFFDVVMVNTVSQTE